MAKKRNSFKKSMNGRYQIKRAMHHGRVKAKYKKQAQQRRKNNGMTIGEAIGTLMLGTSFITVMFIFLYVWFSCMF